MKLNLDDNFQKDLQYFVFNEPSATLKGSPLFKKHQLPMHDKGPKQIRQANINTSVFPKNDYERVTKSMFDNQRRDTEPSLRTITGQDQKVLNLRPLNKSLHLHDSHFRNCSNKTSTERIQMQNIKIQMNTLQNDDIGLPPLNSNQMRFLRAQRKIMHQNKRYGEIGNGTDSDFVYKSPK